MKPPLEVRNGEVTYVMRCGDYVKIGHSVDPERRRRVIFMPGNPFEITIIATFPCGELYERFLHAKFEAHWHRDEWYRIEGNVAAWIARGCPHKKEIRSLLKRNRERAKAHAEWREAGAVKRRVRAAKAALSGRPAGPATWFEKWKEQNDTPVMEIPPGTT